MRTDRDYVVHFPCGCKVTFLGSCGHHTSRMDACEQHNKFGQIEDRNLMCAEARDIRNSVEIAETHRGFSPR